MWQPTSYARHEALRLHGEAATRGSGPPTFTYSRKGVPGLGGEVGDLVENCRYQLG